MKKLLGFILCMTVIPALILAGAAGFIYNSYFKPQPREYSFLRGESEICSVEYATISFDSEGNIYTDRIAFVENTDQFIADLVAIDCYSGIPFDSFKTIYETNSFSGFVINYNDESFEIITPYVCLNSDLSINKIEDLLEADVYVFDKARMQDLIYKYSPVGGTKT